MTLSDDHRYVGRDIFRDTVIRYLGYANEVGEAFRPVVNRKVVNMSYAIASAYVLADVIDKSAKEYKRASRHPTINWLAPHVAKQAVDALLWQSFASIIIPGFVINRTCYFSLRLLNKVQSLSPQSRRWTTTAIGLVSIPFIITPIDNLVDYIMNNTIRKVF